MMECEGIDPDVHHAGGALVVVRDRESLSHGEGEQFILSYTTLERSVRLYEKSNYSVRQSGKAGYS